MYEVWYLLRRLRSVALGLRGRSLLLRDEAQPGCWAMKLRNYLDARSRDASQALSAPRQGALRRQARAAAAEAGCRAETAAGAARIRALEAARVRAPVAPLMRILKSVFAISPSGTRFCAGVFATKVTCSLKSDLPYFHPKCYMVARQCCHVQQGDVLVEHIHMFIRLASVAFN